MSGDPRHMNDAAQSESAGDALAADVHAARQTAGSNPARENPAGNNTTQMDAQKLNDELQQANDRALRAQAELENFRRRMRREMDEERRYAALPLLSDLLVVVDNLDRALAADTSDAATGLLAGVRMVQSQFLAILERHHCRRIGDVGETFDPNLHQAIAQEPSDQIPAGHVTRVAQFGYRLHDRVVRPAQVLVSIGPAANNPPSNDSGSKNSS